MKIKDTLKWISVLHGQSLSLEMSGGREGRDQVTVSRFGWVVEKVWGEMEFPEARTCYRW